MDAFVTVGLTAQQMARLQSAAPGARFHDADGAAGSGPARARFELCEICFGNPPADWIANSRALRWIQLESTGFGEYLALDWQRLGRRIIVTNLSGFYAAPVAESALAGILALYRGVDRLLRAQEKKQWIGDPLRGELRSLHGGNVVLFGHGSINRRLAQLLAGFACTIATFSTGWKSAELDHAMREADVVVCAAPDTADTRDIFDRRRLAILKNTALFANFGRGTVVDEDALADALLAGRIGGAVIDVTRREPLPENHPFWTCPNMLLMQHSGGGTLDETDRKTEWFAANLRRYIEQQPLVGVVDFARGY